MSEATGPFPQIGPVTTVVPDEAQAPLSATVASPLPNNIGRYRIEGMLGQGHYGRVYLARDDELKRPVAIKVPHPNRPRQLGDDEAYLAEARVLASLDHPNIVPVFDVGRTEDGRPYLVSKLIEGNNLAQKLLQSRSAYDEAALLVATVAEALHSAHRLGLVHRDVKPGNILIDPGGRPYVADFGLALREETFGQDTGLAGTPAYMSPEQARGEGHRVDGRSDIFSLGIVFYELLVGQRPFRAQAPLDVLEEILTLEVRPPRQYCDAIPRELERICLKALAKRAPDRYATAADFAEDLRHFLASPTGSTSPAPATTQNAALTQASHKDDSTESQIFKVVPKGLRAFDSHDASFFLDLLPGPRDRDGLPESVRFWKNRIEETDPERTFAVGVLYGPSGCGKSSLVLAGLLPRLASRVSVVYAEATAGGTETRLLKGLYRRCPELPPGLGLAEAVASVRRGQGLAADGKVLLVLDQFEQWLHAPQLEPNAELTLALRQCDSQRVQGLLLVRDDFWLAISRFMTELDMELLQGRNTALVDLFDPRHARKVLEAFGRAFKALPECSNREQEAFLDAAVAGLASDGRVISVRLALFAEMVKSRPWVRATLGEVGGTEGVGAAFLEETFAARTAQPRHRHYQQPARRLLRALLPEQGTDIKGNMRSREELLAASGLAHQPKEFEELLHILDGELRLITPTEPEEMEGEGWRVEGEGRKTDDRFYQLTHDYLVPSLRDWLTRKQKATWRGRAELRLAERAALWSARPQSRNLPSWWEWANIRLLTRPGDWTTPQRKMMRQTSLSLTNRALALVVGTLFLYGVGWEVHGRLRARNLVDTLVRAPVEEMPAVVQEMTPYRRWLDESVREAYAEAENNGESRKQLNASLALLPIDAGQVDFLFGRLLQAEPGELVVICEALRPYSYQVAERLWGILLDYNQDKGRRLRAAATLASYQADDSRWPQVSAAVALALVAQNEQMVDLWTELLRPVSPYLLPALAAFLLGEEPASTQRRTLTRLFAAYAQDRSDAFALFERVLADKIAPDLGAAILGASTRIGFGSLVGKVVSRQDREDRLAPARRQANAATVLAATGHWAAVRPFLAHAPDPTVRSYLLDRLGPGGAEPKALMQLLEREADVAIRRALLLALGEYSPELLPPGQREPWLSPLLELYRSDPDPGVHSAVGWLLGQWGQRAELADIDRTLATGKLLGRRQWYVNGQRQTLLLVQPGTFPVGDSADRPRRRVAHTFALAAREVTGEEFRRFRPDHRILEIAAPQKECPIIMVSWYEAAAYCNWLSAQEGIPRDQWGYLPNSNDKCAEGMQIPADQLRRTGYRLPTEVEWEYACRAGGEMGWAHGEADELLDKYAWLATNARTRSHPVGSLRPNDWGFFDLQGNAWEWCQEGMEETSPRVIKDQDSFFLRGGCYADTMANGRPSSRHGHGPKLGNQPDGFRVARTYLSSP
jgi:serine/threonine protein kinase/formylglycine-generating enzyme required for sulfatase activity